MPQRRQGQRDVEQPTAYALSSQQSNAACKAGTAQAKIVQRSSIAKGAAASCERGQESDWRLMAMELLVEICSHLDPATQKMFRLVCTTWRAAASQLPDPEHDQCISLGLPHGSRATAGRTLPLSTTTSAAGPVWLPDKVHIHPVPSCYSQGTGVGGSKCGTASRQMLPDHPPPMAAAPAAAQSAQLSPEAADLGSFRATRAVMASLWPCIVPAHSNAMQAGDRMRRSEVSRGMPGLNTAIRMLHAFPEPSQLCVSIWPPGRAAGSQQLPQRRQHKQKRHVKLLHQQLMLMQEEEEERQEWGELKGASPDDMVVDGSVLGGPDGNAALTAGLAVPAATSTHQLMAPIHTIAAAPTFDQKGESAAEGTGRPSSPSGAMAMEVLPSIPELPGPQGGATLPSPCVQAAEINGTSMPHKRQAPCGSQRHNPRKCFCPDAERGAEADLTEAVSLLLSPTLQCLVLLGELPAQLLGMPVAAPGTAASSMPSETRQHQQHLPSAAMPKKGNTGSHSGGTLDGSCATAAGAGMNPGFNSGAWGAGPADPAAFVSSDGPAGDFAAAPGSSSGPAWPIWDKQHQQHLDRGAGLSSGSGGSGNGGGKSESGSQRSAEDLLVLGGGDAKQLQPPPLSQQQQQQWQPHHHHGPCRQQLHQASMHGCKRCATHAHLPSSAAAPVHHHPACAAGAAAGTAAAAAAMLPGRTLVGCLLQRCTALVELRLWCAGPLLPSAATLAGLSQLPHLSKLDVRSLKPVQASSRWLPNAAVAGMTDEHLRALSGLTSLTALFLGSLRGVSGPAIAALSALSKLQTLSLTDALNSQRVQSEHLLALSGLPLLQDLELSRETPSMDPETLLLASMAGFQPPFELPVEEQPWGDTLKSFVSLRMLSLKVSHALEPQLLHGVSQLPCLEILDLWVSDLMPRELSVLLEGWSQLPVLRKLTLKSVLLTHSHMLALAKLTQLKGLTLQQVDVHSCEVYSWACLCSLTNLQVFEFSEWNNPLLAVGNLAVLSDGSITALVNCWKGLQCLRYTGKVSITEKSRQALASMPCLETVNILGCDGTHCVAVSPGTTGAGGGNSSGRGSGGSGAGSGGNNTEAGATEPLAAVAVAAVAAGGRSQAGSMIGEASDNELSVGFAEKSGGETAVAAADAQQAGSLLGSVGVLDKPQLHELGPSNCPPPQPATTPSSQLVAGTPGAAAGPAAAAVPRLHVQLLLPHGKISSCYGYLAYSRDSHSSGSSEDSEDSVNWMGSAGTR